MKILIIETNRCHYEVLPMWTHLLRNEEVHLLLHHTAKSSKIRQFFDESCDVTCRHCLLTPLSAKSHISYIKKLNPDLIIFNSAEVSKRALSVVELAEHIDTPIVALCHKKKSYQALIDKPKIHPYALSPTVGTLDTTLNAVYFQMPENRLDIAGLTLCAAGRVSWYRRYYDRLRDFSKNMLANEKIWIVGQCPKRSRKPIGQIIADTGNVHLIKDVKSFDKFLVAVNQCHAICPLIEPGAEQFDAYLNETFSGSINLSIALAKPMIGHSLYLDTIEDLSDDCFISYNQESIPQAMENLRQSYTECVDALSKKRTFLLNRSAKNLDRVLGEIL
jgi:hypothetical protein